MESRLERDREQLAAEIASCPEAPAITSGHGDASPCAGIVRGHARHHSGPWQRPEPWVGPIGSRLLFLSSNPSIAYNGYKRPSSLPLAGVDRVIPVAPLPEVGAYGWAQRAFDLWIEGGIRNRRPPGQERDTPTRFWVSVRARARELYKDWTISEPGEAERYCLSEVVHCKTRAEEGVHGAAARCSSLYLDRLLEVAGARLVVVLGDTAGALVRERFPVPAGRHLSEEHGIAGRSVRFAFLPHPNQRGKRKVGCSPLTADELELARHHLRTAE